MKIFNTIKSTSTRLLIEEAIRRGITTEHVNSYLKHSAIIELTYKNHREFLFSENSSLNSLASRRILSDKVLTKIYLKRAGLSVAKGNIFKKNEHDLIIPYCEKIGFPVVLKPIDGTHGDNVHVNLRNSTEVTTALEDIYQKSDTLLVEKMFKGEEYRILATNTEVLAAAKRVPANIVGDGKHTIEELIAIKNKERAELIAKKALVAISVDTDITRILNAQNLTVKSIPEKDKTIYLREKSNISAGGDSIDVTDIIHPDIAKIAVHAIQAIDGLSYAGIDFITNQDISKKPTSESYNIIEINYSPMISIHRFPYKGTPHHVEKDIIDLLFPETCTMTQSKKRFFSFFRKN